MASNKKFLLLISILVLLNFALVIAQEESLEQIKEFGENIPTSSEELQEKAESQWGYLSQRWKDLLLENHYINKFDTEMQKLDKLFFYLTTEHYSFSLTFFALLFLWISANYLLVRWSGVEGKELSSLVGIPSSSGLTRGSIFFS